VTSDTLQNEVKTKGSIYKPIQLAETAQFNDPQSEEAGNNLNFGSSLKHNNTFIRNQAKIAGAAIRLNGFTILESENEDQALDCKILRAEV
jgi:hypothetical protein